MAIDYLEKAKHELFEMTQGMIIHGEKGKRYWMNWIIDNMWFLNLYRNLVDAEIARQSVTDQQVKDAIVWLEESVAMYQTSIDLYPEEEYDNNWHKAVSKGKTAITALEQMRTEPCEWCNNNHRFGFYVTDADGDFSRNDLNKLRYKTTKFCPNCGRKLGDE